MLEVFRHLGCDATDQREILHDGRLAELYLGRFFSPFGGDIFMGFLIRTGIKMFLTICLRRNVNHFCDKQDSLMRGTAAFVYSATRSTQTDVL